MDFDFTAEQYALRDMARDLFEKESGPARLRAVWDGEPVGDDVWRTLAAVGITGLTVPEEHGGSGGDEIDLALVLEEAGRAALPEPIVETVAIGTRVLGGDWPGRIASGEARVAVLAGPYATAAEDASVLVAIRDGSVVASPRESYTCSRVRSADAARPVYQVDIREAQPLEVWPDDVLRRGAAATACVLNGVSMRLLEMTLAYVKDRHQFGRPVGSFQAIKHKLASMHTSVESARPAAWYACYAIARGLPDAGVAASIAKSSASDAHALVNREALQCHGGIGFTWEHDLHLWLKRGNALSSAYGGAAEHRARIAATLLD